MCVRMCMPLLFLLVCDRAPLPALLPGSLLSFGFVQPLLSTLGNVLSTGVAHGWTISFYSLHPWPLILEDSRAMSPPPPQLLLGDITSCRLHYHCPMLRRRWAVRSEGLGQPEPHPSRSSVILFSPFGDTDVGARIIVPTNVPTTFRLLRAHLAARTLGRQWGSVPLLSPLLTAAGLDRASSAVGCASIL